MAIPSSKPSETFLIDPPPAFASQSEIAGFLDRVSQLPQNSPEVKAATRLAKHQLDKSRTPD